MFWLSLLVTLTLTLAFECVTKVTVALFFNKFIRLYAKNNSVMQA